MLPSMQSLNTKTPNINQTMDNDYMFYHYYNWLCGIALSLFKWNNLPEGVNARWLEMCLFQDSLAVVIPLELKNVSNYAVTRATPYGINYCNDPLYYNVVQTGQDIPSVILRGTYNADDVVPIWNNYIRTSTFPSLAVYAKKLVEINSVIKINQNAQKTPKIMTGTQKQKLALVNLMKQINDNDEWLTLLTDNPNKSSAIEKAIGVLDLEAPYLVDKLEMEKQRIWNEALTFIGVPNIAMQKKERLVKQEAENSQGQVTASLNRYMITREMACDEMNKKFNLDKEVSVEVRDTSFYESMLDIGTDTQKTEE